MLLPTRIGTIHSGDAYHSISRLAGLVRVVDPASRRSGPGQACPHHQGGATPSRRRCGGRHHLAAAEPGARPRRQEPSGNCRLGTSEWCGATHRPVVKRTLASLGRLSGRRQPSAAGGKSRCTAVALGRTLSAYRRWQQLQSAWQQGDGLAAARGLRSEPGPLQPCRGDRPAWRGIVASLCTDGRRSSDRRPRLCQGQGIARLSRSVRPPHARLHHPGWLESAGPAQPRGATQRAIRSI